MTAHPRTGAGLRPLVGNGQQVPCLDRHDRRYVRLDVAASTSALPTMGDDVAFIGRNPVGRSCARG